MVTGLLHIIKERASEGRRPHGAGGCDEGGMLCKLLPLLPSRGHGPRDEMVLCSRGHGEDTWSGQASAFCFI